MWKSNTSNNNNSGNNSKLNSNNNLDASIIKDKTERILKYTNQELKEIQNSERRSILFSRLPAQKYVNPDRYDTLITFWSSAISDVSKNHKLLIFTPKLLQKLFTIQNISPMFLSLILNELEKQKEIQTYESYITEIGWSRWIWNKFLVPLWGGNGGGNSSGGAGSQQEQKYIITSVVEELAESLYQLQLSGMHSTTDNIVSYSKLVDKMVKEWSLTREELDLLLFVLVRGKKAIIVIDQSTGEKKGVKFAVEGEIAVAQETDFGILKLKNTYDLLIVQEQNLLSDIEKISSDVLKSVRLKQKTHALLQLKRKKVLEGILEKRTQASNNIHEILFSIESAQSNQQVLDSLCTGVSTLKKINERVSVDQIDSIMDSYHDTIANQQEIDDAMKSGFTTAESINNVNIDDEQLEKELEQFEREQQLEKEKEKETIVQKQPPKIEIDTVNKKSLEQQQEEDELLRELESLKLQEQTAEKEKSSPKKQLILES
eukprot:gene2510-3108_t